MELSRSIRRPLKPSLPIPSVPASSGATSRPCWPRAGRRSRRGRGRGCALPWAACGVPSAPSAKGNGQGRGEIRPALPRPACRGGGAQHILTERRPGRSGRGTRRGRPGPDMDTGQSCWTGNDPDQPGPQFLVARHGPGRGLHGCGCGASSGVVGQPRHC